MVAMDTSKDAHRVYVATFAAMSGGERVALSVEMAEQAKAVALAGIRFRQPGISEDEIATEWLRLLYGDDFVDSIA